MCMLYAQFPPHKEHHSFIMKTSFVIKTSFSNFIHVGRNSSSSGNIFAVLISDPVYRAAGKAALQSQ